MIIALIQSIILLAEGSGSLLTNPDLWRVINLLVFVLILVWIFRSKVRIGDVFNRRAASIVKELEEARIEKQEAQQKLAELEARLGRLDEEVAEIRAEAERESQREAERIRQAAVTDAEKIRQGARREIEGAMKSARTELRAYVAEASVAMAENIIRREMRPEDNARMLNKYIEEIGEVSK
jgi:F-type H+-transporting ATPase subunit b